MAWVNPRTWLDGIRLQAAQLNQVSENLRQTAPAKAQAAGDLFFATARNAIARLPLGAPGTFLRPGSDELPEWGVVPTPITTRGDLVRGDASGNPVRIGTSDGVRIFVARNGNLDWQEEIFAEEWWEHSQWWTESANADMELEDGDRLTRSETLTRYLDIGGAISCDISPAVIRAKRIRLTADATIRCLSRRDERSLDLPDAIRPNAGGSAQGYPGSILCGGAGDTQEGTGPDGSDANQSVDRDAIKLIARGDISVAGGGNSGAAATSASRNFLTGVSGGGVLGIFAEGIDLNGYSLTIDCSGEDGSGRSQIYVVFTSITPTSVAEGGGGGGAAVIIVQGGVPSITIDVSGGSGGSSSQSSGGSSSSAAGGDGGNGTTYTGTSIPS